MRDFSYVIRDVDLYELPSPALGVNSDQQWPGAIELRDQPTHSGSGNVSRWRVGVDLGGRTLTTRRGNQVGNQALSQHGITGSR